MIIKKVLLHLQEFNQVNLITSAITNFRLFGFKGLLKMPVFIKYGSKLICKSKDGIVFLEPLKRNMLTINSGSKIKINKGGKLLLTGRRAFFNNNTLVFVSSVGLFEIGNNFWVNRDTEFYCRKSLKFGNNVLIAFHVIIMDTDYHPIFNEQTEIINSDKEIVIGNNVWLGCNVTVLKGTHIGNNIVVGAGSLVTGHLIEENSIYFGCPAKQVKSGITWSMRQLV